MISVEFVSNVYFVNNVKVAQCNIRDMTEHMLAEKKIRTFNAELEQCVLGRTAQLEDLNKELETFSYSVSHDLQAPLRRIMAYIEALRKDVTGRQSVESSNFIEKIRVSAERMNNLIGALLELAHLSRQTLGRQSVDLSAIANLVVGELVQSQPDRQVKFDIAGGMKAHCDAQLLRIVLENLFYNSWKYTSRHASAHIEFGATSLVDGNLAYFVRDDGAGFDMAYAHKLFGTFQRLHSEKEFPGIGIGLATVQRIVNRHNGRVWAESVVEKSTTFYFTLGKE